MKPARVGKEDDVEKKYGTIYLPVIAGEIKVNAIKKHKKKMPYKK